MKTCPEDTAVLEEALSLMQTLEPDPEHALQVRRLGASLWKQTSEFHRLPPRALVLFEAAALLHDIGWLRSPEGRRHHKHSAAMIREHSWKTINMQEVGIVSQTARFHRKSLPKPGHARFAELPAHARHIVQTNAALLRLADSLDRSHRRNIREARLEEEKNGWVLTVLTEKIPHIERYGVEKKKDLFEVYFKTRMRMVCLRPTSHTDCPVTK